MLMLIYRSDNGDACNTEAKGSTAWRTRAYAYALVPLFRAK